MCLQLCRKVLSDCETPMNRNIFFSSVQHHMIELLIESTHSFNTKVSIFIRIKKGCALSRFIDLQTHIRDCTMKTLQDVEVEILPKIKKEHAQPKYVTFQAKTSTKISQGIENSPVIHR